MLKLFRNIASLLLVALLIGMVADGARAAETAIAPAVTMSADGGVADCNMCDSSCETAMVCGVYCSSNYASAMAFPPAPAGMLRPNRSGVEIAIVRFPADLGEPPDPFPPKSSVLS